MVVKPREQKTVEASYIITFYREVHTLTDYYAQYYNLLLELENKLGYNVIESIGKLGEEERTTLVNVVQLVRMSVSKCYIQYKSIVKALNASEKTEIANSVKVLRKNFIIKREDLEKCVIGFNAFLVEDIMNDLLQNSQDLLDKVFNDGKSEKPTGPE